MQAELCRNACVHGRDSESHGGETGRNAETEARERGPRDCLVTEFGPCVTLELKPLMKFKLSFDR